MPILDAYNTMELQPNPGFTDDGVWHLCFAGRDGSVEINEKIRRGCDRWIDYYLTTIEKSPEALQRNASGGFYQTS